VEYLRDIFINDLKEAMESSFPLWCIFHLQVISNLAVSGCPGEQDCHPETSWREPAGALPKSTGTHESQNHGIIEL